MKGFPIVRRHHLDGIPRTPVKKCTVRTFGNAFLATNTKIRIDFNAPEWRMIFVGNPKHASFDGTILDARRGTSTTSATIGSDRKDAWLLLSSRFSVALRHGPMFVYDVVQIIPPPDQ